MSPNDSPKHALTRYPQHHEAIQKLPGVDSVITWDEMDIIVLDALSWNRSLHAEDLLELLNSRRVKLWWGSLSSTLTKLGVDIYQVGFTSKGNTRVLRLKKWEDGVEFVWAGSIGIGWLKRLWVAISDEVGSIIPAHLHSETSFERLHRVLLDNFYSLKRLWIDPSEVVIGARFQVKTGNSVYTIFVNKAWNFEIESSIDGVLKKNTTLAWFNNEWQLLTFTWGATTPVTSMKKLA